MLKLRGYDLSPEYLDELARRLREGLCVHCGCSEANHRLATVVESPGCAEYIKVIPLPRAA